MIRILLLICLFLSSCTSPTEALSQSANTINRLASSSNDRFIDIAQTSQEATIVENAKGGETEQKQIIELVDSIHINLQGVEDKVPYWATLMERIVWVLGMIGIAFILWQTGLGYILKRFFWGIGWFIPKKIQQQVELDQKHLDDDDPATLRETIASRRASDPAYEYAWKNRKRS